VDEAERDRLIAKIAADAAELLARNRQPSRPAIPGLGERRRRGRSTYFTKSLTVGAVTLERIRGERTLQEALVVGPDPLPPRRQSKRHHRPRYGAIARHVLADQLNQIELTTITTPPLNNVGAGVTWGDVAAERAV
jgi:hypothetical protein